MTPKILKPVLLLFMFFVCPGSLFAQEPRGTLEPVDYVNPFIGTAGMGHVFPGACTPFGAVQLSPDTDTIPHNIGGIYQQEVYAYCAGYQYTDPTIVGFSHTHFSGTGHSDLGDLLVMPTVGPLKLSPGRAEHHTEGYRSAYRHEQEAAEPGYYRVHLDDYAIDAELTASPRVGVHRYTYPADADTARVVLDLNHGIYNYDGKTLWASLRVESPTLITGYRITNGWARTNYVYFAISLSKPIINYGYTDHEPVRYNGFWRKFDLTSNFPEMAGRKVVAYFEFDNTSSQELEVKVALSATGTDGALKNLRAETEGKSFDTLRQEARGRWAKALDVIRVEGTPEQKAMYYTSLYHTMINPSLYMDVDGAYRGLDGNIHRAEDFTNYTIFSLWDTYRAEHPLLLLLCPDQAASMGTSMVRHQQQSVHGLLPIWSHNANENWCMSGYHSVSVLSDLIDKNAGIDAEAALAAMVETAGVPYLDGLGDYIELGYVPWEASGTSASNTLEYCYDDWTIYRAAKTLGRQDVADAFSKRALNYRNLFDPETRYIRPKLKDGSFRSSFDRLQTHGEGFIEGNSQNFTFHVPHDVAGLMELIGGDRQFIRRLDELFESDLPKVYYEKNEDITEEGIVGAYVHGNEPSHHIPYLYAWTSQPWKTQERVRDIMNKMYHAEIRGLRGNDDCGQMSAWYIFTAMGFYPVCPGTDQYILGAPYLPYQKVSLPNGKILEIKAPKVSDRYRYIRRVTLNGKPLTRTFITYDQIMAGGVLEFEMSYKPNKRWGTAPSDKPYSLSTE